MAAPSTIGVVLTAMEITSAFAPYPNVRSVLLPEEPNRSLPRTGGSMSIGGPPTRSLHVPQESCLSAHPSSGGSGIHAWWRGARNTLIPCEGVFSAPSLDRSDECKRRL